MIALNGKFTLMKSALEEYKSYALAGVMNLIPEKGPRRWLYDLVSDYPLRSGKGFRPALCIATCKAFGGQLEDALNSAVSIELFHNAFLVHDDIEDESLMRRGLPTLHMTHGIGIALNTGDAMNVLSIRPLMENMDILGPELTWKIFSEIEHMVRQSVEGQAIELGWRRDNVYDLTEADYLSMILKKTCWYTCIHPIRIGALIATYREETYTNPDIFNRFGYFMGAAFQIQDDLLNLSGKEGEVGKEILGDLQEGKRTLMLIHLLNHCCPKEKQALLRYLSLPRPERTQSETEWVYQRMQYYGSIDAARTQAKFLAGAAMNEFYSIFGQLPNSSDKAFMEELVLYMIQRDY